MTVKLWDTATWQERASIKGHSSDISMAAFAPDGQTLTTASQHGTVKLWDTAALLRTTTLGAPPQRIVQAVPGTNYYLHPLAFSSAGGQAVLSISRMTESGVFAAGWETAVFELAQGRRLFPLAGAGTSVYAVA